MKTKVLFIILIGVLSSCSQQKTKTLSTAETKVIANHQPTTESKMVVNHQLDSVFVLMVDAAKNYFAETWSNVCLENPSVYKRDSLGNRIMHVSFNIQDRMSWTKGNCVIKIEQVKADTIITQSVPYSNGNIKKSINKLRKSEIVILVNGFILSHSKNKTEAIASLTKVLEEDVFTCDGEVLNIRAQIN